MIFSSLKKALQCGIAAMALLFGTFGFTDDGITDSTGLQDTGSESYVLPTPPIVDPIADHPPVIPLADAVTTADGLAEPMMLLNDEIAPGASKRLSWSATELFEGVPVSSPVLVVNGKLAGPTLCLTAAVHGDELK